MARDVVVGLGNEGPEYRHTRHNLGACLVDFCTAALSPEVVWQADRGLQCFWAQAEFGGRRCCFLRPMGFMNTSGIGLQRWLAFFKKSSENAVICCDDITLPPGELKVTFRPGTAGHRGVEDVLARIGPGFVRFRLGIGPKKHPAMDLRDYVLGRFSPEEQACIDARLPFWKEQLERLLDRAANPLIKVP